MASRHSFKGNGEITTTGKDVWTRTRLCSTPTKMDKQKVAGVEKVEKLKPSGIAHGIENATQSLRMGWWFPKWLNTKSTCNQAIPGPEICVRGLNISAQQLACEQSWRYYYYYYSQKCGETPSMRPPDDQMCHALQESSPQEVNRSPDAC